MHYIMSATSQGRSQDLSPKLSCSYSAGMWPRIPKLDTLHESWTQKGATWGNRNHNLHFLVRLEECGRNGAGGHKSQGETVIGQGRAQWYGWDLCRRLAMLPESCSWLCSLQDPVSGLPLNSLRYLLPFSQFFFWVHEGKEGGMLPGTCN